MEYFKNNPYSIFIIPLFWGIYEFRKLRYQLLDILKIAEEYKPIVSDLNQKIEELSSNKTVFQNIHLLTNKINRVFNVPKEEEGKLD